MVCVVLVCVVCGVGVCGVWCVLCGVCVWCVWCVVCMVCGVVWCVCGVWCMCGVCGVCGVYGEYGTVFACLYLCALGALCASVYLWLYASVAMVDLRICGSVAPLFVALSQYTQTPANQWLSASS
jgi:hypothetical protein